MKTQGIIILTFALMTGIISCQKEDDSELIALEERILNAYLENNNISVEPTESGLYFIQETEGTGATPAMDDWVLINYDLYLIHGEQLIYTSEKEKAIEYGIYDSNLIYGPSKNPMGRNIKALDEGLTMMKEGGKATLLFKSDLGFGKQRTGLINPYEPLKIVVELVEVIEDPVEHEKEKLSEYLATHNFSNLDTMESGLLYVEIEEGEGDSARNNFYVSINVKGYLLDGRKFLDEEVYSFQLGQYYYEVPIGLAEGVSYMKEKGKSRLIVPSDLGYGKEGKIYYEGVGKKPIPPYSTLVYDVELLTAK